MGTTSYAEKRESPDFAVQVETRTGNIPGIICGISAAAPAFFHLVKYLNYNHCIGNIHHLPGRRKKAYKLKLQAEDKSKPCRPGITSGQTALSGNRRKESAWVLP